jgi:hypothetical protein
MSTQVAAALGRLRSMLAAEAVTHRFALFAASYGQKYDPNQPRVPAGNSDGGQWTSGGGSTGGGVGRTGGGINDPRVLSDAPSDDDELKPGAQLAQIRGPRGSGAHRIIGGRRVELTPAQETRAKIAESQTATAIDRVRTLDPNWRPTSRTESTADQYIENTREMAREAQARYETLRSGIGGNFGPPLTPPFSSGAGTPPAPRFDGHTWINAYREVHVRRDLFGNRIPLLSEHDTVAAAEVDGQVYFGVNSTASTYADADFAAGRSQVNALAPKYPNIMSVDNLGRRPNDSGFHAETTVLTRVARDKGGTLAGRSMTVLVDKDLCMSCELVLPKLGLELGNPTVTYIGPNFIYTMKGGHWISRRRR